SQSPGVQAYLVSKENSALLLAMLRGRTDFQELSAVDMVVYNGQSQVLEQIRGFSSSSGISLPSWKSTKNMRPGCKRPFSLTRAGSTGSTPTSLAMMTRSSCVM